MGVVYQRWKESTGYVSDEDRSVKEGAADYLF